MQRAFRPWNSQVTRMMFVLGKVYFVYKLFPLSGRGVSLWLCSLCRLKLKDAGWLGLLAACAPAVSKRNRAKQRAQLLLFAYLIWCETPLIMRAVFEFASHCVGQIYSPPPSRALSAFKLRTEKSKRESEVTSRLKNSSREHTQKPAERNNTWQKSTSGLLNDKYTNIP